MPIRLTKSKFIEKSTIIHGEYNYSLVDYKNSKTPVKIICTKHGIFEQRPNNHLNGQRCPSCAKIIKDEKLRWDTNKFIEMSNKKHNYLYDYSLVRYTSSKKKVNIICKKHGKFKQMPCLHISGQGCVRCAIELNTDKSRCNTDEIINRFNEVHGDRYDYSLVNYIDAKTKVIIICKKHGEFKQIPHNHLFRQHCPNCSISKGVEVICDILKKNNLRYKTEQSIPGCVSVKNNLLKFDIFIEDINIYIEYDGEQHFRPVECWGGEKSFIETKKRDLIKDQFCLKNNIELFRISYLDNIEEKLNVIISSYHR